MMTLLMGCIVMVIQEFFNRDRERTATQIMLKIHLDGKAFVASFKDVATAKSTK
jgi:ATP-dependent Clp protease adapter protein ClpS